MTICGGIVSPAVWRWWKRLRLFNLRDLERVRGYKQVTTHHNGPLFECLEKIEQALEAKIGSQECADTSEFTPEEFCLFKHDVFTDRSGSMRALESPGFTRLYTSQVVQDVFHQQYKPPNSQPKIELLHFGRKSKDLAQGVFLRSGALSLGPTKIWLLNGVQWHSHIFHVFFSGIPTYFMCF